MITPLKRSMVFIDGSNLHKSWKRSETSAKLDYEKIMILLTNQTECVRGYFYDTIAEGDEERKNVFLDVIRNLGITVVMKPLRYKNVTCKHCQHTDVRVPFQKGVDIALATDLIMLAYEDGYDKAIVISGDNDFVPAIEQVKRKGKQVVVATFRSGLGLELRRSADRVIYLDEYKSEIFRIEKNK